MKYKLLTAAIAAAFATVSGASWAQVSAGGNTVSKDSNVAVLKTISASKNKTVSKHGVGANTEPVYPKAGTHLSSPPKGGSTGPTVPPRTIQGDTHK